MVLPPRNNLTHVDPSHFKKILILVLDNSKNTTEWKSFVPLTSPKLGLLHSHISCIINTEMT